jgi:hypothetical protein
MTRLVWLIAALIVIACVVFAAAQTGWLATGGTRDAYTG